MTKSVCVLVGHPHDDGEHFCRALAETYADGAVEGGHNVTQLNIAAMTFPLLRDPKDFATDPPHDVLEAQRAIKDSEHVVVVYPLWLGAMPALVKAFFEQLGRNEFAIAANEDGGWPLKMLKGRSAHVIVTMGMPSTAYRLLFGAHSVKGFETMILGMAGFKPIRDTLIGGVGPDLDAQTAEKHLATMRSLGRRAA